MTQVPDWTVTTMTPKDRINDNAQLETGFDVAFTTRNGHVGSVFVPKATFTPQTVADAITPLAQQMLAVAGLTSDQVS